MPIDKSFGSRLKELRLTLGMGAPEMAKNLNRHLGRYRDYECGGRYPTIPVLLALHTGCGVNLNWLLTGYGEMF